MSGLKLVVPTVFTDPTLPKLRDDAVLPDAGCLMLIEPGHPVNPLVGVPPNGGAFPNIALSQAQAMIPGGTAGTLGASMSVGSSFDAAGLRERTSKGGLHFITAQASAGDNNRFCQITGMSALSGYQAANQGHALFVSLWLRRTRAPVAHAANDTRSVVTPAGGYIYTFYSRTSATGDTNYPTDSRRSGWRAVSTGSTAGSGAVLGPVLYNVGLTAGTSGAAGTFRMLNVGNFYAVIGTDFGKDGSYVFYRYYLEDLTVSGRSYATVDALDYAEFTKQVVNSGGRYYGDTYTDPATAAP